MDDSRFKGLSEWIGEVSKWMSKTSCAWNEELIA